MRLKRTTAIVVMFCCCTLTGGMAVAQSGAAVETLTTTKVADGLSRPVAATHAPDDYTRLFIVEQHTARIKILNLKTGEMNPMPFIDLDPIVIETGNERGLLGLAFHPAYRTNGHFYVNYIDNSGDTVIARYTRTADPGIADPSSQVTLLTMDQPFGNHNGGWMGFSPKDGYLYISSGDGGSAFDPGNRAQDITDQLLGKMLRIDVDGASPYGIPDSNPFVGVEGDDEIWAYGLRNAWRCSFDRQTGDLYIADVGQDEWEEVDFEAAGSTGGANYGWRCMEGTHCTGLSGCVCGAASLVMPIHEYSHGGAPFRCSITGGYVYRGCAIPSLDGHYFFADYCSNQIWSFIYNGGVLDGFTDRTVELDPPGAASIGTISSFGEDARGELYVCDLNDGEVFKIVGADPIFSPADIDCSGAVDVVDLLSVLGAWGPCDGCMEDLTGDHIVDVLDLLVLLSQWG